MDDARAARAGATGEDFPLRFRRRQICMLPAELPLDALEPLLNVQVDLPLILRTALDAVKAGEDGTKAFLAVLDMVVDLVVMNKDLPAELLAAVKAVGRRVMGDDGYEAFVQARPSINDVIALIKGLGGKWGVGLGESSPSSTGSPSSTTSTPTSAATSTDSTSTESGVNPAIPASSASVGSSVTPSVSLQPL